MELAANACSIGFVDYCFPLVFFFLLNEADLLRYEWDRDVKAYAEHCRTVTMIDANAGF